MNQLDKVIESLNDGTRPIPEEFSTLERMIDLAFEHAKTVLIDGDPESTLQPCWSLVNNRGNTAIIVTPFTDGERSKEMAALALRVTMKATGTIRYTFACEAWMANVRPGEQWDNRMPSQRDDRIEVVMINGADAERSLMKSWEIVRGDTGAVVDLKPHWTQEEGVTSSSGRFANLLEEANA